MQNGETARVRYDTAPSKGILTKVSAACSNHLKLYSRITKQPNRSADPPMQNRTTRISMNQRDISL
nr:hypothetical protein Iba_chr04aCG18220 [Ipomoea batatas]GMC84695.1 hypothetical protein Iba_chr04cCG14050 [Ipomoea batatas]GMC89533.1 hypothetical protein Iba_chr04eCG20320 [Ipomoea batatas]